MAVSEIQDLKWWMHARDGKARKKKKLNVNARMLTSEEGRRLVAERDKAERVKAVKKKEEEAQRAAKEAQRDRQRAERDPSKPFTGSLALKSKPDLIDLVVALNLSKEGSKADLLDCITRHFNNNNYLKTQLRYVGLFNRARGRKRSAPINDGNQLAHHNELLSRPATQLRFWKPVTSRTTSYNKHRE